MRAVVLLDKQFLRFASVGVVGTTVHYSVLLVLVELLNISVLVATAAGFVLGALTNYILNYHFTFNSRKKHSDAMTKFFAVALMGLGLNQVIMWVAVGILFINYLLSQVVATLVVLFFNYLANRSWSFKESG